MARILLGYTTPWRGLMMLVAAAGLITAAIVDQPLAQVVGVVIAVLAVQTLLAQLHHSQQRVGRQPRLSETALRAATARRTRRVIGRSSTIVSVVIPGKNEAAYARDCIESLKEQTLENFEAIVVDDCSTDSTLDVVLEAIGDDPRFRVFRTDRSIGPGLARNQAVAASVGKYVTFLDLDDFLAPDALAARVELAEKHADLPWIAGSYCWHDTVDVDAAPETWLPPPAGRGGMVSWMGHYDDNVVIVSTPLLRRDAFIALGGFDDVPTAEDPIFWFKLLRWGFVLVGTGNVGVAYRQKPTSRAVATAIAMRDAVAGLLTERNEARSVPPSELGPFYYAEGLASYRSALGFTRRTAAALGMAVADGSSDEVIDRLVDDLRGVPFPLVGWEVDVVEMAVRAARRVTRARNEGAKEGVVGRRIQRRVGPLIEEAHRSAARWLEAPNAPALPLGPAIARPVRRRALLTVTPPSLRSLVRTGRPILLLPSAAYHTDELMDLVEELRRRGFSAVAMLNEYRWGTTSAALAKVDVPAAQALPAGDWLLDFEALLTFNDWGEYFAEYVRYVAGKRPVSFGKVEGVQDWEDHDTGRVRNAYLASDVILCQGDNDVRALEAKRGRLEIVGSARLEGIWSAPLPADAAPRVVGNVNFTYGVQEEHRALWVETLRDACRRADVPLDLSLHPSEKARYPGIAASDPIRHLMVQDTILVSRFSTVLFEGMARGCSVIYYNPHGEKVPTFQNPEGAFDVAEDPDTLAALIEASKTRTRAEAKARATDFFMSQVSIIPGESVATRTAETIERHLLG